MACFSPWHAGAIGAVPLEFDDEDEEADLEDEMAVIGLDIVDSDEPDAVTSESSAMAALRVIASSSTEVNSREHNVRHLLYTFVSHLFLRLKRSKGTKKSLRTSTRS